MLLGSPPDMVHGFPLRGTDLSSPLTGGRRHSAAPGAGIHPCCSGLQVQGTAISPTSAALLFPEVKSKLRCILLYFPQNGNLFFQICPFSGDIFKIGLYIF